MAESTESFLHPTPMLDELEKGPWPSFITGLKKLANRTHNPMVRGALDQLEYSYETKMGYWKGGVVGVRGYGAGIIPRFSTIADKFPASSRRQDSTTPPSRCAISATCGSGRRPG